MHVKTDAIFYLWSMQNDNTLLNSDLNKPITVLNKGVVDKTNVCFRDAHLVIDGIKMRGDVVFDTPDNVKELSRNAILRVIGCPTSDILTASNGSIIAQTVFNVSDSLVNKINNLKSGDNREECMSVLYEMSHIQMISFIDELLIERLERKCGNISVLYDKSEFDWSQTLYSLLCRSMGGGRNQEAYIELSQKATLTMLLRERTSQEMLEALLLGTSGLLEGCYFDDYIHRLRDNFTYLRSKYQIIPMRAAEWDMRGFPSGSPIIRLVQIASLIASERVDVDNVIKCRNCNDLYYIFDAEVSDYWTEHYSPDLRSRRCSKRLGSSKIDILGINMVVPFMFTYGDYTGNQTLKEYALDLLAQIKAENNKIINAFTSYGLNIKSAYDSQAYIQLFNEYCEKQRCTLCKVGRIVLNQKS